MLSAWQARHLKVHRQQRRVPVIGNVHQVVVPIVHSTTGHMPDCLQGSLAQKGTSEGNLHPVPSIYVVPQVMETRVVHKHIVHSIYVAVKVANLHRCGHSSLDKHWLGPQVGCSRTEFPAMKSESCVAHVHPDVYDIVAVYPFWEMLGWWESGKQAT